MNKKLIEELVDELDMLLSNYCDISDYYVLEQSEIDKIEDDDERYGAQYVKDIDDLIKRANNEIMNNKENQS